MLHTSYNRGLHRSRAPNIAGTQVHTVRVPGFVVSTEVIFGLPEERLRSATTLAARPSHTSPERCSRPDESLSSSG